MEVFKKFTNLFIFIANKFIVNQHLSKSNVENNIHHVASIFIDPVLKAFLEVYLYSLQHFSIDLDNFHNEQFLSNCPMYRAYMHIHVPCGLPTINSHVWKKNQGMGSGGYQQTQKRDNCRREGEEHPMILRLCGLLPHPAEAHTHRIGIHFYHNSGTKILLNILT